MGTTTYDQKIESLLPDSEPAVQSFAKLREELGGDAAFIVVWHEPELMAADGSGLTRLKQIVEQSQALPEVLGTLSLLELNRALQMMRPAAAIGLLGGKANPYPIVDADDPLAASFRDMFAGYTHAPDGKWAGVVVLMKPGADHAHVIREVRAIAEAVCGPAENCRLWASQY